jgi:hypothetical protein
MSDIFLSYKSEDKPRAKIIAKTLEQYGYSVWWDRIILPGKTFDEVIKEALNAAKCVIVLWSKKSVLSDWVKEEAENGKKRHILVPILIDDVEVPMGFGRIEAAQLVDWQGKLPNPEFDLLLKSVREIMGKSPELISHIEEENLKKKTSHRKILLIAIFLIGVVGIFLLVSYWPVSSTTPIKLDLSSFMTPVRDQGNEASVVGFAVAEALEYQIYKKLGKQVIISPRYIYYYAKIEGNSDPHSDTGTYNKYAIQVIQKTGGVSEDVWPYIAEDLASNPPEGVKAASKYKIVQATQITSLEEIKSALQKYGPVVTGISVYKSFSNTQTGIISDPAPTEYPIGSIAICIVGYDDDRKLIKFKNSWGTNWGDNGYGYISYDYVKKYSSDTWWIFDITVV